MSECLMCFGQLFLIKPKALEIQIWQRLTLPRHAGQSVPGERKIRTGLGYQGKETFSRPFSVSPWDGGKATDGLSHTQKDLAIRSLFCSIKITREVWGTTQGIGMSHWNVKSHCHPVYCEPYLEHATPNSSLQSTPTGFEVTIIILWVSFSSSRVQWCIQLHDLDPFCIGIFYYREQSLIFLFPDS